MCVNGTQCSQDRWKCGSNECIKRSDVCSFLAECPDESDEDPEMCREWQCSPGYWKCKDGSGCVELSMVCNERYRGRPVCRDGSDQWHCKTEHCPVGMFTCKDNSGCILNDFVCDGLGSFESCADFSDEDPELCKNWTCSEGWWKCADDVTCVLDVSIFNGKIQCPDGSDENSTYHIDRKCTEGSFKCADGFQCIPNSDVCDGNLVIDWGRQRDDAWFRCRDGSDELHCDRWNCTEDKWKCADDTHCIPAGAVCDGANHCNDKSDEHNQLCGCPADQWPCLDGDGCVTEASVWDGIAHCNDESDEAGTICLSWNCTLGRVKCQDNKQCVRSEAICDGKSQCYDTSDEVECLSYSCLEGSRKCANNLQCIEDNLICNGAVDCKDVSDELCTGSCLKAPLLNKTIVRKCVEDDTICVPVGRYCDGVADCPYGSDEAGCSCSDWNMKYCLIGKKQLCAPKEWLHSSFAGECLWNWTHGQNGSSYSNNTEYSNKPNQLSIGPSSVFKQQGVATVQYMSFDRKHTQNMSGPAQGYVIHIEDYVFLCRNRDNFGITFVSNIYMKLSITSCTFVNCTLHIGSKSLMLDISHGRFEDSSIHVDVISFLNVPTVINLSNTSFIKAHDLEPPTIISILSQILLINISNCTLVDSPLEVINVNLNFQEQVFYLTISETSFFNATKDGNGGALKIKSHAELSQVIIKSCYFFENKATHVTKPSGGQGGAVYLEGKSLVAVLDQCVFENNVASRRGSVIYAEVGVALFISDVQFSYDVKETDRVLPPLLSCQGKTMQLTGSINVSNHWPDYFTNIVEILDTDMADNINIVIHCPAWLVHKSEHNAQISSNSNRSFGQLSYRCTPCSETYYSIAKEENIIAYGTFTEADASTSEIERCANCPYGAICSGNNVIPRHNYWGYWHHDMLTFQQCPTGYCCVGTPDAPCKHFDFCAHDRTGDLCGVCQEGFSVSILTGLCMPDSECGGNHWFWLLAFLAPLSYAMWYTLKDDIIGLLWVIPSYVLHLLQGKTPSYPKSDQYSEPDNSSKPANSIVNLHAASTITTTGIEQTEFDKEIFSPKLGINSSGDGEDKGYFGIVTYFVQMSAVMRVALEFDNVDQSKSVLDVITMYINRILNFELSEISFNFCPVSGLTTRGKHIYKLIFLVGIFLSWLAIYLFVVMVKKCCKSEKHKTLIYAEQFRIKLVKGVAEIIKYTYVGFCSAIFMSLVCVKLRENFVWWYDASNVCLERWQLAMVLFGAVFALPFPVSLYLSLQLLKEKRIKSIPFVMCCLCPLGSLIALYVIKVCCKVEQHTVQLTESSKALLSVMQGPYRQDDNHATLYWECIVSLRRLVISALTLLSYVSIRMVIVSILSALFFIQHIYLQPFQVQMSNHVESLSLFFLIISAVMNLLKALLTDFGVVPSGPSVAFFKQIELVERSFVIILIIVILIIEIKQKIKRK